MIHDEIDENDFRYQNALGLSVIKHIKKVDQIKEVYKLCESMIQDDPYNDVCLTSVFNDDYFWLK